MAWGWDVSTTNPTNFRDGRPGVLGKSFGNSGRILQSESHPIWVQRCHSNVHFVSLGVVFLCLCLLGISQEVDGSMVRINGL